VAVAFVAAGIVVSLRGVRRRAAFGRREILGLDEIHASLSSCLSPATVEEVWARLGKAYGVRPGAIRGSDTMGMFASVDSWDLWGGGGSLVGWVEELNLQDLAGKPNVTVEELARRVEAARRALRPDTCGEKHGFVVSSSSNPPPAGVRR
jgi:hypothetical protein